MTAKAPVMDLVVKIEGGVQETNLADFEKSALQIIENINTELVTDDDFATAEQNIKDCKQVEDRIAQAKQDAMHSIDDISALFTLMDRLQDQFSKTRLDLGKKVKQEKASRKTAIIDEGIARVKDEIAKTSIAHSFAVMPNIFMEAVKGKRSIEKMQEAVTEAADGIINELWNLANQYDDNMIVIEDSLKDYPGLFHDRKTVALKPAEEVKAIIESRVNDFKLKQLQKAEAERKAKEEAERKATEKQEPEKPTFNDFPEVPQSFNDFPEPPKQQKTKQRLTVHLFATDDEKRQFLNFLIDNPLVEMVDVVSVKV